MGYILAQMNNFVHKHVEHFLALLANTHGPHSEAWGRERSLLGAAAPNPRRTPRFRALWAVRAALEVLGEGDGECVPELSAVVTIGGV